MKKTFLSQRNALLSPGALSLGVVVLAGVLVVLFVRIIFPSVFIQTVAPLWRLGSSVSEGLHTLQSGFKNATILSARVEQLENDNATLMLENTSLAEKLRDLDRLLGSDKGVPVGILAGVLARPPETGYDVLVVDAGERDGVVSGMAAYGAGGVPLGIVSVANASSARITLFSAAGFEAAAWAGTSRIAITLVGQGGGAFAAEVSKAAGVSVGDAIFLPGPGALVVGTVTRIDSESASPQEYLRITPVLNPLSVTWVLLRTASRELFMQPGPKP